MNISYHTYALLKNCRKRFEFEKILKRPPAVFDERNAIFGHITQRLFEHFYVEEWFRLGAGAAQKLYNELPNVMREQLARHTCLWEHRSEVEILERDSQDAIPKFLQVVQQYGLIGEKNESEKLVEYDISKQFRITGRIDFLIRKRQDLYLLDGKGTKYDDRYLDKEQLLYYMLIMRQLKMKTPTKVGFWLWRDARIIWYDFTNQDVEDLYTKVKEVLYLVQKKDYLATPSSNACKFCPYKEGDVCSAYQAWHKKNQDVRNAKKIPLDLPAAGDDGLITSL